MTATTRRPVDLHLHALREALAAPDVMDTAVRWGEDLAARLTAGARLLVAGNGGSAAQAQHLSAEIVGRYCDERDPFSSIALHSDTSAITAIANDYGVDEIFARQVRGHGRPGDVVVLMSTSGRSPNLVSAAHAAHERGLQVWSMTGRGPNPLSSVADEAMCIDAATTATVQEVHLVALHVICEAMDAVLLRPGQERGEC